MRKTMRPADLLQRLEDNPFKPFRIHLSDGTQLDVIERWSVIVGPSTAVVVSRFGEDTEGHRLALNWRTIDLIHIVQFSDLNDRTNGKHPRGRRRKS